MSHNRYCRDCSLEVEWANNDQISAKAGPYYEHLQRRRIMAARRALLAAEQRTS
jgi:hypothetical protein